MTEIDASNAALSQAVAAVERSAPVDMTLDGDTAVAEMDALADWYRRYTLAKAAEKLAKEKAEEARGVLAAHLDAAGAEFGTIGGRMALRWRAIDSNRFATTKFRKAYPELAEEFTETSSSMRMEIVE